MRLRFRNEELFAKTREVLNNNQLEPHTAFIATNYTNVLECFRPQQLVHPNGLVVKTVVQPEIVTPGAEH